MHALNYVSERARAIVDTVDVNARARAAQAVAKNLTAHERLPIIQALRQLAEGTLAAGPKRAPILNIFRHLRNDEERAIRVAAGAALMRLEPVAEEVQRHVRTLDPELQKIAWAALDQGFSDEEGRLTAIKSLCAADGRWRVLPILQAIQFDSHDRARELVEAVLYSR